MSLTELYSILNGIDAFKNKVAYRSFPIGSAPSLPFICYLETSTNNAFADNTTYKVVKGVDVELYTETKDLISEELIENALYEHKIPWNKTEQYIDSEHCYQITYSMEV